MIRESARRLFWCRILLILNLAFIWGNSILPADSSSAFSQWVQTLLGEVIPPAAESGSGFLLRKLAHFSEFAGLGFLLCWMFSMRMSRKIRIAGFSLLTGFLCACADETIQMFSPGRCPSPVDVGIDTAGAAAGIAVLFLGYYLIKKRNFKIWRNS